MTIPAILCLALVLAGGPGEPTMMATTQPTQPATAQAATAPAGPELNVLCTTFPIHLFARNVAARRDNIHLRLLVPAGAGCPHDYVITPQDMQAIAAADAVIINGLGMEDFLAAALKKANPRAKVINSAAGLRDILYVEATRARYHRGQEYANSDLPEQALPRGGAGKFLLANPHAFASPRMAAKIVANIAEAMCKLDPAGARVYAANAKAYAARLNKLADQFSEAAKKLANRKIVTEHAVFDYLARDCGLEIVALVREAPETEPSAAEMLELIREIAASGAGAVFSEPQYGSQAAEVIAKETGLPTGVLDPVATGPADAPLDYYEKTMTANLKTLRETLGGKD